ncbi:hypothetical protein [Chitinophaga sp. 22620]|uniref:hypothetical protein n=1 Tax=Chitinophaga sp. 22620 TaxID=3453952 RepID=UPI003F84B1D6
MKKALLGIALLNLLCACSKKSDERTTPELPPEKIILTRILDGNDSLVLKYDGRGIVTRVADWTGNAADSFEVIYDTKGFSEFQFFAFGQKRTDRRFVYDGNWLVAVNYYNMGTNGEPVITDKDSLVYKNAKLAEYHEISGGVRGGVHKLTWQGDDVSKVEYFLVNGGTEIPVSVNTYTYTNKLGYQHAFRADFLLYHEVYNREHKFSHLSASALIKDEQKAAGSGVLIYTANYTPSYNEEGLLWGLPKQVVIVKDDKQSNEITTSTLKLEYETYK